MNGGETTAGGIVVQPTNDSIEANRIHGTRGIESIGFMKVLLLGGDTAC